MITYHRNSLLVFLDIINRIIDAINFILVKYGQVTYFGYYFYFMSQFFFYLIYINNIKPNTQIYYNL